jgi:hypothetical protein
MMSVYRLCVASRWRCRQSSMKQTGKPSVARWSSVQGASACCLVATGRLIRYAFAVVAVGVTLLSCEEPKRTPIRYMIPEGYVGWFEIDYNVPTGAAPEREGKYVVYRIPANGHLITSAHYEVGWATDEHYYYNVRGDRRRLPETISGRGGMVWGEHEGRSGDGPQYEREFIGTEKQYWATANDPLFWPPKIRRPSPPASGGR